MHTTIKRDPKAGRRTRMIVGGIGSLIGIAATTIMVRRRRSAGTPSRRPSTFNSIAGEDRARFAEA